MLLALAADHVILDDGLFHCAVKQGLAAAQEGRIVVFGLPAAEPNTSYGYIEPGKRLDMAGDVFSIRDFVEKPDRAAAERYIATGYLWNSGNFLFRADAMMASLASFAAPILEAAAAAVDHATEDHGVVTLDAASFARAPKISIDYAVLQHATNLAVVKGRFRWSDVGSWDALWHLADRDADGNASRGDAHLVGCRNCYVHAEETMATLSGVENLIVIATGDAVMVTTRQGAQGVKDLVARLKASTPDAMQHSQQQQHDWGFEETITRDGDVAVKRLVLRPGGEVSSKLSTAMVHWVVVAGAGHVRLDDLPARGLSPGQSIAVEAGSQALVANTGTAPLTLLAIEAGGDSRSQRLPPSS